LITPAIFCRQNHFTPEEAGALACLFTVNLPAAEPGLVMVSIEYGGGGVKAEMSATKSNVQK